MKDTENRPRTTIVTRKGDEADGMSFWTWLMEVVC